MRYHSDQLQPHMPAPSLTAAREALTVHLQISNDDTRLSYLAQQIEGYAIIGPDLLPRDLQHKGCFLFYRHWDGIPGGLEFYLVGYDHSIYRLTPAYAKDG